MHTPKAQMHEHFIIFRNNVLDIQINLRKGPKQHIPKLHHPVRSNDLERQGRVLSNIGFGHIAI